MLVIQGKFDEAIALYEALLKERPEADVLINNLASLLSENRQDKESLRRAYEMALPAEEQRIAAVQGHGGLGEL